VSAIARRPAARRWRWPAEPATARRARRATGRALAAWHLERLADDATLIISELVANACRHGGGPVTVTLRRTPGGIRGEVGDALPAWPLRAVLPPRHGLRIVLALARKVEIMPRRGGGKCVCFDLDDDKE
jgi:Histidine kinase-like ATPase domain